jgi:site-specific recombinase XerD
MATIKLREKPLQDGRLSLYLDIYEDGQRRYEFLKLYIYPETNDKIKAQNRETRKFAEVVRGKRLVEAQNTAYGFAQRRDKALLLPTFEKFRKGRKSSVYRSIAYHIRTMYAEDTKVANINERWLVGYCDKLHNNGVSENSIAEYISLLRVFWRWSVSKGIVSGNPFANISLNTHQAVREYLTIEELQRLIQTPTNVRVREPFLFSCFTGLRWSDVIKLTWGDVEQSGGRTRIIFRQQKTGAQEYMDLNEQAVLLMGERGEREECIFNPHTIGHSNIQLRKWASDAGITKHLSFHCARHTFATMLLTLDTDIYTVSKLLGHSSVSTTQIYAKIVDKKKQEAVDRIPQML